MYRSLHCTAASDPIHATLAATQGARDLAEACCGAAVIARRLTELRSVAQLESLDAGDHGGFTEEIERLEQGEVVLNVPGSAERVSSRISSVNILRRTYSGTRRTSRGG